MNKKKNNKRILFITLSNIGDVILTTPVLVRLNQLYKNAKFDIVGDIKSEILFKNCLNVHQFFRKDKTKGFAGTLNLILKLRKVNYDIAVDLRSDGLLYFLKAKKKYHKINNNSIHSVEKHFLSIGKESNVMPHPRVWLSTDDRKKAKKILPKTYKTFLVLGLGANSEHKIWPIKEYIQLACMLKGKFDFIVLVGNEKDNQLAKVFKKSYKDSLLNFCGQLDLLTTAAVLEKAELFIGNDSGLGHIASAVKTKTFTIFGPGEPHRYKPWGNKAGWMQEKNERIKNIKPKDIYEKIFK